jgi:hypothetical protein
MLQEHLCETVREMSASREYLQQAAKLNFAAVALTTAVKVKVIFIITITTYLSAYFRCNLTKFQLVTVKF